MSLWGCSGDSHLNSHAPLLQGVVTKTTLCDEANALLLIASKAREKTRLRTCIMKDTTSELGRWALGRRKPFRNGRGVGQVMFQPSPGREGPRIPRAQSSRASSGTPSSSPPIPCLPCKPPPQTRPGCSLAQQLCVYESAGEPRHLHLKLMELIHWLALCASSALLIHTVPFLLLETRHITQASILPHS